MGSSSGLGIYNSGLPIDDIITKMIAAERKPITLLESKQAKIKQKQAAYTNVQAKVADLLASIKKLTTRNADGTTIFEALTGTSSHEQIATATAAGTASPQTLTLEVKSLPSQTRAVSQSLVGKFDASTTVDQLGISAGNFTVFVNGTAHTYTVNAGDTIGSVLDAVNNDAAVPEITGASIVNGKISFSYSGAPATKITFGAGGDTSNFLAKTRLNTAVDDGAGTIAASQVNTTINLNQSVSNAAANLNTAVTDGTFTINGISFSTLKADGVTSKTMSELMSEINASAAKVTASFNMGSNTFQLVSKDTGSTMISLGDSSNGGGTSNFLTAMGLIDGGTGNTTASQTAGKNTEFVLNGATMYATSNTVDETVTGLTGVTLNLKTAQVGTTVTLNIQKDSAGLKTAVTDLVDKYNKAIAFIDQQTDAKSKAILSGESRLMQLRNQLRSMVSSQVSGLGASAYDSLQLIGISTSASAGGSASPQLKFDAAKFDAAMAADAANVKKLFIGQDLVGALNGTTADDNLEGAMTKALNLLNDQTYTNTSGNTAFGALYNGPGDNSKGLFYSVQSLLGKRVTDMDKSIDRAEDRLALREKTLRQQFLAMDRVIGQYQSQGTALTNLMNQLSANNNS